MEPRLPIKLSHNPPDNLCNGFVSVAFTQEEDFIYRDYFYCHHCQAKRYDAILPEPHIKDKIYD